MTDPYSKGDKVRATHKETGEVHEFEVEHPNGYGLGSTTRLYFAKSLWDFEKLTPALPTKAGMYRATSDKGMNKLIFTTLGEWYWLDFTAKGSVTRKAAIESIQERYAATITPLYLYGEES